MPSYPTPHSQSLSLAPVVNVSSLPLVRLRKLRLTQMWQLTRTQLGLFSAYLGGFVCALENKTIKSLGSRQPTLGAVSVPV